MEWKKERKKEKKSNKGLGQPTSQTIYPTSGMAYKDTSTGDPDSKRRHSPSLLT
jgi:hypothetical protein